jgi:protein-tyrosine-phosphatase
MMRIVLTRRELMERAEARLRTRGGEEGAVEASRCFLRAMLASLDESAPVPDDLVARVGEFLKIDLTEHAALRRASTRPPPSSFPLQAGPGERRRRVLFLGRNDSARVAMFEAVARAVLADDADVRAASLTPIATDPRTIRVLRHAGYATEVLSPRAVTVDDLSWADLVVTVGGEREDWERFLPRSTPHQHEVVEDPVALARSLSPVDELEPFRSSLRSVERSCALLRPPRSSRMPAAPASIRPSWSKIAIRPADDEPTGPSSTRPRTKL